MDKRQTRTTLTVSCYADPSASTQSIPIRTSIIPAFLRSLVAFNFKDGRTQLYKIHTHIKEMAGLGRSSISQMFVFQAKGPEFNP